MRAEVEEVGEEGGAVLFPVFLVGVLPRLPVPARPRLPAWVGLLWACLRFFAPFGLAVGNWKIDS